MKVVEASKQSNHIWKSSYKPRKLRVFFFFSYPVHNRDYSQINPYFFFILFYSVRCKKGVNNITQHNNVYNLKKFFYFVFSTTSFRSFYCNWILENRNLSKKKPKRNFIVIPNHSEYFKHSSIALCNNVYLFRIKYPSEPLSKSILKVAEFLFRQQLVVDFFRFFSLNNTHFYFSSSILLL